MISNKNVNDMLLIRLSNHQLIEEVKLVLGVVSLKKQTLSNLDKYDAKKKALHRLFDDDTNRPLVDSHLFRMVTFYLSKHKHILIGS